MPVSGYGKVKLGRKPCLFQGMGKRLGFLPRMLRLRALHQLVWYLVYGRRGPGTSAGGRGGEADEEGLGGTTDRNAFSWMDSLPAITDPKLLGEHDFYLDDVLFG